MALNDLERKFWKASPLVTEDYLDKALEELKEEIDPSEPVLVSLSASPASVSVAEGATQQLTITGSFSDSSTDDVTSQANYVSDATSVATVSAAGLVTGVAEGSAEVTVSIDSISTVVEVTVTGA